MKILITWLCFIAFLQSAQSVVDDPARAQCDNITNKKVEQATIVNYGCQLRCISINWNYTKDLSEGKQCPKWFGNSIRVIDSCVLLCN